MVNLPRLSAHRERILGTYGCVLKLFKSGLATCFFTDCKASTSLLRARTSLTQVHLSLSRACLPAGPVEILHVCLMLARNESDNLVVEWCNKVVADDENFLGCEEYGMDWRPPSSFMGRFGFPCAMIDFVSNLTKTERKAVGHAAAIYQGAGGTEVPTPETILVNYLALLKHTDKKKVLQGPSGVSKCEVGAGLRKTDLAVRVAHVYLANRSEWRALYLNGMKATCEDALARGESTGARSPTVVQVLESLKRKNEELDRSEEKLVVVTTALIIFAHVARTADGVKRGMCARTRNARAHDLARAQSRALARARAHAALPYSR